MHSVSSVVLKILVGSRTRRSSSSSSSTSSTSSNSSSCCCCWQHVRLPPRGVVRFLGWHVLKLEFWHFGPWTKNLGFCFRIGICGIFYKKSPHLAHCTVQQHARLILSHRVFRCFLCLSHFHRFLQCLGHLSTFCTCRLRLAVLFLFCAR